ncbi:MAG: hypothetical protein J2P21_07505, partial [Chloracidobacterium sp.]|nr:hypothetical protein [Chloracidobacterium sp.]
ELWEDLGRDRIVKHYRVEVEEHYPRMARRIGSRLLDHPHGERDDYLRVYQSRHQIGEWGRTIVERSTYQNVFHYRGHIFEHMRWGFLMCLQSTVIRREACEAVGLFETEYYCASDYAFTIELCRRFDANYLSIPTCVKHELAEDGGALAESHVATGRTALICFEDMLLCLERYWGRRRDDPEISALLGFRRLDIARLALERYERATALMYLKAARRDHPGLRRARYLQWLITLIPGARFSCGVYITCAKVSYILGMIRRKEMTIGEASRKLARRLLSASPHPRGHLRDRQELKI